MAVYDDQKTKPDKIEDDELRKITGIDVSEEKSMEDGAYSGAAEDIDEKNKLDNRSGSEPEGEQKIKNNTSKKKQSRMQGWISSRSNQYIAGALVTLLTAILTGAFITLPSLVVNHLGELLKNIDSVQIEQRRRYRRKNINKISDMFTRDGRRANKLVQEMQARGYKPKWDPVDNNKLLGFTAPDGLSSSFDIGTTEQLEDHINQRHPFRTSRWKTKRMDALYTRYNIPRKSVVILADTVDESIERIINKRLAEGSLDDDPRKISFEEGKAQDGETDPEAEERNNRNKIASELIEDEGPLNGIREKIKSGTPIRELDADERAILRIGIEFNPEIVREIDNIAKSGSIGGKVFGSIKSIGAGAVPDIYDRICTIKGVLRGAMFAARVYRFRALAQYASMYITPSDETRTGLASSVAMGELMRRITSPDKNGNYIGSSSGFQRLINGRFSKSKNDDAKSAYSVDGSPSGFSAAIHNTTKDIPGSSEGACKKWQNPGVQIGASVLELGLTAFTGGAAKAGTVTAKTGIEASLKAAFTRIANKQIAKQIAIGAATGFAIEIGFDGAMVLLKTQAERALTINTTGQEIGEELGEILAAGGGGLSKQMNLDAGLVPATTAQYQAALDEYEKNKIEQRKGQSFYARVFDYNNHDSLLFSAANVAFASPALSTDINTSVSNMASGILSMPNYLIKNMGTAFSDNASAQASDDLIAYDSYRVDGTDIEMATDQAGNVMPVMIKEIEEKDPIDNMNKLIEMGEVDSNIDNPKPTGDNFIGHIQNCVDNVDILSVLESNKDVTDPKVDCLAKLETTKMFKAHLLYLDMLDGIDAGLFPEEIAEGESAPSTGGSVGGSVDEPSYAKNPAVTVDGSPPGAHRASNCTGTFTVGANSLKSVIEERWKPPVTSIGGYSCRAIVGGSGTSVHGLGRALDVMIDANSAEGLAKGNEIRNWVINNSTQLGVQRVIWNRYTWAANRDGWNPYTGSNAHTDHLHIEVNLHASTNPNLGRQ